MNAMTKMTQFAPFYLAIQGTILVTTFLDFPVYVMENHLAHNMAVTPWVVAWLMLTITGMVFGISALLRQARFEGPTWKVSGSYLTGALVGFVTLGIRFMPLIHREYFFSVGLLTLALVAAFTVVKLCWTRKEELFP